MRLAVIDWTIILAFLAVSLAVGALVTRRAGSSASEFFLSGRNMPWWLLGISMVATTFSTDTPNLVTDIVRTGGVAGNWVWWAFLLTGMLTTLRLRPALAALGRFDRRRVLRAALLGQERAIPARLSCRLSRRLLQRHDHGLGHAGGDQDRRRHARHLAAHRGDLWPAC